MEYAFLTGMYPRFDQEINDTPLNQGSAYAVAVIVIVTAVFGMVSLGYSL